MMMALHTVKVDSPPLSGKEKRRISLQLVGGLTTTSKMPGYSYSLPAQPNESGIFCRTGSQLRKLPDSTCADCYACKGRYSAREDGSYRFANMEQAMQRKAAFLQGFLVSGDWRGFVGAFVECLTTMAVEVFKENGTRETYFRWHDSGDIQSVEHLEAIIEVARLTEDIITEEGEVLCVKHWLPTREYKMVREAIAWTSLPDNLVIRISALFKDKPAQDVCGLPTSTVASEGVNIKDVFPSSEVCSAYEREGKCGDCRACWDSSVKDVCYPIH